ncbi:unnamed protein product [Cuscuta campestris]|uniref:Uncharacterized protein n=1 Tax=Cuscuta campestris TaxID=132261 RepID=A0A484MC57_9ASTE|nr:unnamed protein product [Cuscuta campestris]VFQ97131.1 unnamed protein product [Cuscuta campestris]
MAVETLAEASGGDTGGGGEEGGRHWLSKARRGGRHWLRGRRRGKEDERHDVNKPCDGGRRSRKAAEEMCRSKLGGRKIAGSGCLDL